MALITGIHAENKHDLLQNWWQITLVGCISLAVGLGIAYILYLSIIAFKKFVFRYKSLSKAVLPSDIKCISQVSANLYPYRISKPSRKPQSFGVYLSKFERPPTSRQIQILSEWDLLIFDPSQDGIIEAMSSGLYRISSQALARLDIGLEIENSCQTQIIALTEWVTKYFRPLEGTEFQSSCFTGISLSNWAKTCPVSLLKEFIFMLNSLGISVFLEVTTPSFLHDVSLLELQEISGLVIRNGLISQNGKEKDVLQMSEMRPTIKAFMSQACLRDFVVLLWETVDDGAQPLNAVIRRSYRWSRFYNALLWIGTKSSLESENSLLSKKEPLGALDWLKDPKVMKFHEKWKNNQSISLHYHDDNLDTFDHLCFSLLLHHRYTRKQSRKLKNNEASLPSVELDDSSCKANETAFKNIVQLQSRLKNKCLLDKVEPSQVLQVGIKIQQFSDSGGLQQHNFHLLPILQGLAQQLTNSGERNSNLISIYRGLHSGFQTSRDFRFWSVYDFEEDGSLNIYISRNCNQNMAEIILHTFLSSHGCQQLKCLEAEFAFAEWSDTLVRPQLLPKRFLEDISSLAPSEQLIFLRALSLTNNLNDRILVHRIKAAVEENLLNFTDFQQLKKKSTVEYLSGRASAMDLVSARTKWYQRARCQCLDQITALEIFLQTENSVTEILKDRKIDKIEEITTIFAKIIKSGRIDARIDLMIFSVFCAFRKHAFDEAYIEVTDRNALFNDQSDQAAAFAELFVTGTNCEAYFDIVPSDFGQLLSERYRAHHHQMGNEPPLHAEENPVTMSAYAAARIDVDTNQKKAIVSTFQNLTFLSVFAIPALIDILLLTTTGRGLYLSGYMSQMEQRIATLALMISLLISGAVGTWVTCGGSYYLTSMAFSAMNVFIVTRLVGGLAFTLIIAAIGLVFFWATEGAEVGFIFFFYLIALNSYLCLLATLANFQYSGSAFLSGRPIILTLLPFMLISPLISMWIPGYDIFIYFAVFSTFLILLIIAVLHKASKWATWYTEIENISDQELKNWYIKRYFYGNQKAINELTEPYILKCARDMMSQKVEVVKKSIFKKTRDSVVEALAKSHNASIFLLEWYCGYSGTPIPIPFSSTWNMQTRVALQTLEQLQTGMRLHNGFIHWRQAGDEVGCNTLYFIVALLDKWNALLSGRQLLGLSTMNIQYRMPVGFALAYYLIGAVLLDFNSTKLHSMSSMCHSMLISDVSSVSKAVGSEIKARRLLYWNMLGRYCLFHVWSLAISCSFLWIFNSTKGSTIIFLFYVGAYTVAISAGIPLGQSLRRIYPDFIYGDVTSLAVATWTAAILSLCPGKDPLLSQDELCIIFHNLSALDEKERYCISPKDQVGLEIESILLGSVKVLRDLNIEYTQFAIEAFPNLADHIELIAAYFKRGDAVIEFVSAKNISDQFNDVNAISYSEHGKIRVIAGYKTIEIDERQRSSIKFLSQIAAEIIAHIIAETIMGMSHKDASLIESILAFKSSVCDVKYSLVSTRFQDYLRSQNDSLELLEPLFKFYEYQIIEFLSLNYNIDLDWESLPYEIRDLVTRRCTSQEVTITKFQHEWLLLNHIHGIPLKTYMARCDFGVFVALSNLHYALDYRANILDKEFNFSKKHDSTGLLTVSQLPKRLTIRRIYSTLKYPISLVYHKLGVCLKLLAIAFVADPELQRELDYALRASNTFLRGVILFFVTGIWHYTKWLQHIIMPIFLLHRRTKISRFYDHIDGTSVSIKRRRIVIENINGLSTAFMLPEAKDGTFEIRTYQGDFEKIPEGNKKLQRISIYKKKPIRLLRREEFSHSTKCGSYEYEYSKTSLSKHRIEKYNSHRYPIRRKCLEGNKENEEVNFNHRGFVENGSFFLHGSIVRFSYHYRLRNHSEDELLRADFILPHLKCTVSWSVPPERRSENLDEWIAHSQVTEAMFIFGHDVYESHWNYDHKFHPTIQTTLNGKPIETIPMIEWDHLGVLKKPQNYSIHHDDPLISFKSLNHSIFSRWLGLNTHQYRISTSYARSRLWETWRNTSILDGVIARWLDERLLRKDQLLRTYWRRRDRGDLIGAEMFLNANVNSVMAAIDLDSSISSWAPLAIKTADLYSFGQGGDANSRTRSVSSDFDDGRLQVLALDSGTWPNEGGGVSACRRDLVNNLYSVNWYMVSESANDFGLPKHQTEINVRSLKIIPLWGLDFLTPTHGLFKDRLDAQVEHIPSYATKLDVEQNFIPILTALVRSARTIKFKQSDINQATRALVNLNTYFSGSKHWRAIWTSTIVKNAWRNLWSSPELVSPTPSEKWFQAEIPTIGQLDTALELWFRYLFIFSIPIPEKIPAIFQASHHGTSASYGVVCKLKRNCILQIWDHAISWREANLYLSSDLCNMAPFIRNSLLGLMNATSKLVLHHADIILPCADYFNAGWEIEIGTGQGLIEHRNKFKRKIDPVVNGIIDISRFRPVEKIESDKPTVTMLSHVWYAKDIKTAILAADVIVNEWGFKDYRLKIYGAIDKAPSYSTDCFEIIASKSLSRYVTMCGESNPASVLRKTWVFMNSSISEGLPLALGEAALSGAPVVCTNVGASLQVLTDIENGKCYSAIVAPNDPRGLARAQINLLAMLDEWAAYADDSEGFLVPTIPEKPTQKEIEIITARMYEKTEQRKALGMKSRRIVQKSFDGKRYLREHEQMLWIGKIRHELDT
ncbi:Bgt-5071 [Blumeria graminis f. sp. tritici]|uniref:Bgt-5071 n=2 Tax=Blumeria graminis f. sp. tritici TaxID=62690 RepID=A0A9X9MPK2_BLUGR|nr:hypothetical protein BGT96224_5071 [Blumeria graminis f. sp. tritici 96224]VDB95108.1 Bgt-5071 [Blumeria graminis f. sp. tritici]